MRPVRTSVTRGLSERQQAILDTADRQGRANGARSSSEDDNRARGSPAVPRPRRSSLQVAGEVAAKAAGVAGAATFAVLDRGLDAINYLLDEANDTTTANATGSETLGQNDNDPSIIILPRSNNADSIDTVNRASPTNKQNGKESAKSSGDMGGLVGGLIASDVENEVGAAIAKSVEKSNVSNRKANRAIANLMNDDLEILPVAEMLQRDIDLTKGYRDPVTNRIVPLKLIASAQKLSKTMLSLEKATEKVRSIGARGLPKVEVKIEENEESLRATFDWLSRELEEVGIALKRKERERAGAFEEYQKSLQEHEAKEARGKHWKMVRDSLKGRNEHKKVVAIKAATEKEGSFWVTRYLLGEKIRILMLDREVEALCQIEGVNRAEVPEDDSDDQLKVHEDLIKLHEVEMDQARESLAHHNGIIMQTDQDVSSMQKKLEKY